MKKFPVTERLDEIIKESSKLIDSYQAYESSLSNLASFARNYLNDKFISEKLQEILSIKKQFEVITTDFKDFKREYQNEFDSLMQEYFDKYDKYLNAVMYSMNKRITLQNVLLNKSGTLISNISLIRDMKNAIHLCMQSGLEVNKILSHIQQKT